MTCILLVWPISLWFMVKRRFYILHLYLWYPTNDQYLKFKHILTNQSCCSWICQVLTRPTITYFFIIVIWPTLRFENMTNVEIYLIWDTWLGILFWKATHNYKIHHQSHINKYPYFILTLWKIYSAVLNFIKHSNVSNVCVSKKS